MSTRPMKLDNFVAWVQAILSALYLACTFVIILIYELGYSKLTTAGQEKTFDGMVNWMTGGALIVLYFWLQRAKAQNAPDPATTTTTLTQTTAPTTPSASTVQTTTTVDPPPTTSVKQTVTTVPTTPEETP